MIKSFVEHFVTPQVTNINVPIGGVNAPMAFAKINTMAKWIGSIPYAVAAGANNGTRTIMLAFPSTNMPTKIRKISTATRKIHLLWITEIIHWVNICGIISFVRIQENVDAAATISMMDDVVIRVSFKP